MSVPFKYGSLTEIQMQPDEVQYIENVIDYMGPEGLMTEWGSGGSTIHWLNTMRHQQHLITVEHNEEWFDKVSNTIDEHFLNLDWRLDYHFSPELYGFEHGYANLIEEHPTGLDNYMLPDKHILDSNIFFIDGIARATIALMVLGLSKEPDPAIFIHDYVGREPWYDWVRALFPRSEVVGTTLLRLWK